MTIGISTSIQFRTVGIAISRLLLKCSVRALGLVFSMFALMFLCIIILAAGFRAYALSIRDQARNAHPSKARRSSGSSNTGSVLPFPTQQKHPTNLQNNTSLDDLIPECFTSCEIEKFIEELRVLSEERRHEYSLEDDCPSGLVEKDSVVINNVRFPRERLH